MDKIPLFILLKNLDNANLKETLSISCTASGKWELCEFCTLAHESFILPVYRHSASLTCCNNKPSRSKNTCPETTSVTYLIAKWPFLGLPNHLSPSVFNIYHEVLLDFQILSFELLSPHTTSSQLLFPQRRISKLFPVVRTETDETG